MTLITHLKTKHFDIIMGDGMITTRHGYYKDAQKVYNTYDEKYLIGYCGDLSYRNNEQHSTPTILQGIMSKTFNNNTELQNLAIEKISDSLGCDYGNTLVIEFITSENGQSKIVKYTKSRVSLDEMMNDEQKAINQYSDAKEVSSVPKNFLLVEAFSYHPSRYNDDENFTKAFKEACEEKNIDVNEEIDKEKLFDLLKYLYFDKIYPIVDEEKGIGGKITIIIKPLDGKPIQQKFFYPS